MTEGIIQSLFGKAIHMVDKADVVNFFRTEKRETDIIEFKSYIDDNKPGTTKEGRDKEKINDLIRTICGFLNSDGGVLIWGTPKGKKLPGSKEQIHIGELTPVQYKLEPDQFINKIAAEISPTPLRIRFQPIDLGSGSYCYLFEVDKSEFAPHQHRGTYYMRMDGSTRPAPHHYVEALMKKVSYPPLEVKIHFGQVDTFNRTVGIPLLVSIHNLSRYQHDKKVQFILQSTGAEIRDLAGLNETEFESYKWESRVERTAKEILHYNMPYYEHFLLITKRVMPREPNINIRLALSVWGELSPVVVSTYDLLVYSEVHPSYYTTYQVTSKNENVYLMDLSDKIVANDEDAKRLMQIFEKDLDKYPLIKLLDK